MNTKVIALAGSLLGLAAGSVSGYFFAKKTLEQQYADLARKEIAEAKAYLGVLYKDRITSTPAEALVEVANSTPAAGPDEATLRRVIDGLRYGPPTSLAKPAKQVEKNIFDGTNEDDPDEDESHQDNAPYVISVHEYSAGERNYTQVNLTYYEADEVLADEDDQGIDDDSIVGGSKNLRFGFKSGDPNVVFIRNDKLQIDYEILRSGGSYAEEVHGIIQPRDERPKRRE